MSRFRRRSHGLILLATLAHLAPAQSWHSDFESLQVGEPCVRGDFQSEGFAPNDWDNGLSARSMVDTAFHVSGTKSLRVMFPKGQYGPNTDNGTGIQVELLLDPRDEYFMSYFVRFDESFSWGSASEGGKLPGLTNRNRCGDDFLCDGTDGFSARFMWRRNGKGVLYLYHADMPQPYGQDFAFQQPDGSDFVFRKGLWYHIAERVKNNTRSDAKDGIVQVWINGIEVLHMDTIRFQTNGDQIDNFFLSTFHGGSSAEWAPTDTSHLWMDDLRISTTLADVAYRACSNPDHASFGESCPTDAVIPKSPNMGVPRGTASIYDLRGARVRGATAPNAARLENGVHVLQDDVTGKAKAILHVK